MRLCRHVVTSVCQAYRERCVTATDLLTRDAASPFPMLDPIEQDRLFFLNHDLLSNTREQESYVTNQMYRFITLIAVCSMFAAVLTYSRAMAENPGDIYEESNICMPDTHDTGAFEEAPVSSVVAPGSEDVETLGCTYASCRVSADCPADHPAAPFFCANRCCVPL